jgi:hypothetical protein
LVIQTSAEKVGKIVPEILGIESPKKFPIWGSFLNLQKVRDNIIHQKQSLTKPNEIESGFLKTLLEEKIFTTIMSGFGLIQYFCEKDEMHSYFPILNAEMPCKVNIIDRFSDIFTGPLPKPSNRKRK